MSDLSSQRSASTYLGRLSAALLTIDPVAVQALVQCLLEARANDRFVFIAGNGGSATTASHMATDLGVGSARFGVGIRTISLADNVGVLTATGNDVAFDAVFAAQVRLLGRRGDVLVAISASGNSPNIISALESARSCGMTTVGLVGFDGGRLVSDADICIHVKTDFGDYGPVEDAHLAINHMVTEMIRSASNATTAEDRRSLHG